MKASELIKELTSVVEKHGDLNIGVENVEYMTYEVLSEIEIRENSFDKNDPGHTDDQKLGEKFIGLTFV